MNHFSPCIAALKRSWVPCRDRVLFRVESITGPQTCSLPSKLHYLVQFVVAFSWLHLSRCHDRRHYTRTLNKIETAIYCMQYILCVFLAFCNQKTHMLAVNGKFWWINVLHLLILLLIFPPPPPPLSSSSSSSSSSSTSPRLPQSIFVG